MILLPFPFIWCSVSRNEIHRESVRSNLIISTPLGRLFYHTTSKAIVQTLNCQSWAMSLPQMHPWPQWPKFGRGWGEALMQSMGTQACITTEKSPLSISQGSVSERAVDAADTIIVQSYNKCRIIHRR